MKRCKITVEWTYDDPTEGDNLTIVANGAEPGTFPDEDCGLDAFSRALVSSSGYTRGYLIVWLAELLEALSDNQGLNEWPSGDMEEKANLFFDASSRLISARNEWRKKIWGTKECAINPSARTNPTRTQTPGVIGGRATGG